VGGSGQTVPNTKHKHRKHADIHASSGIRTNDPSAPAGEIFNILDYTAIVTISLFYLLFYLFILSFIIIFYLLSLSFVSFIFFSSPSV
jgi:hypothetical protein